MAFKYGNVKFDAKSKKVDDSGVKVYSTFEEPFRRAMQGISNRVMGHTASTGGLVVAECALGTTCGAKITNTIKILINGALSTCIAQDNLHMPTGTQGTGTYAKYLIASATGTSGTIIGPGNVVEKTDYTTDALAKAAAKLPDLPDGYCALGYFSLAAGDVSAIVHGTTLLMGTGGTAGTAAYQDLVCMPYNA